MLDEVGWICLLPIVNNSVLQRRRCGNSRDVVMTSQKPVPRLVARSTLLYEMYDHNVGLEYTH